MIDKTGLKGAYDADVLVPGIFPSVVLTPNDSDAGATGVSVFTAIRDDLGLKLTSENGAVDVLVIDHVEHATED